MTFESLFTAIKEIFIKADVRDFHSHMAFEFQVQGEATGVFYVVIKEGRISVEPYEYHDRDALFVADGETYLEICRGELNPMLAFAVGRLKVEGDLSKAQLIGTLFV